MSINIYERKDRRGGGYAKRKFTYEEAEQIREEYTTTGITQNQLSENQGLQVVPVQFWGHGKFPFHLLSGHTQ